MTSSRYAKIGRRSEAAQLRPLQHSSVASASLTDAAAEPCCAQTLTEDESIEQILLETQQNLQKILLQSTTTKRLPAGDYFILNSPEGYEFRALVSGQGIVDGWYIADWDGMPNARCQRQQLALGCCRSAVASPLRFFQANLSQTN